MSYIGRGVDAISNVEKLDNITFNGGTTYALTKSSAAFTPVGANNILVSIDGVIQQGNFSVSTTNIVFDWSPTSSNTCNFILHYGTGVLNVPADGSIVAAKMAANSVDSDSYVDGSIDAVHLSANSVDSDAYVDGSIDAVHLSANSVDSDAYVDGSIDTAHIGATQVTGAKLNTDVISAQTALAVAPADTDEFMVSDGGVLKRIDYSLIKGGGITDYDTWYLTTDLSGGASPISSNLASFASAGTGHIGSAMTVSSGIWTFPSTGYWIIIGHVYAYLDGNSRYITIGIHADSGIGYTEKVAASTHIDDAGLSTARYASASARWLFDVTSTSTHKCKFNVTAENGSTTFVGATTALNYYEFIRIGDT